MKEQGNVIKRKRKKGKGAANMSWSTRAKRH